MSGRTAYIGQLLCGCTANRVNGFFSIFIVLYNHNQQTRILIMNNLWNCIP